MSNPRKHHFLPEFYLRRWAGADRRVVEFRRVRDRVVTRRRYPSETGFEAELYAVRSRADPQARQHLESRLMAPIDNAAAEALRHLETSGSIPDDQRLRAGWLRFLMSLLHRSPQRLVALREIVRETEVQLLGELEAEYEASRTSTDPPTYADYVAQAGFSVLEETLSLLLQRVVNSNVIGQVLGQMVWGYATIRKQRFGLLTSDTPLIMSNGLGTPDSFLILPLSPQNFFIAAASVEVVRSFVEQQGKALERSFNDAVVCQAHNVVIASDIRQQRFVEARLHRSRRSNVDRLGLMRWLGPHG